MVNKFVGWRRVPGAVCIWWHRWNLGMWVVRSVFYTVVPCGFIVVIDWLLGAIICLDWLIVLFWIDLNATLVSCESCGMCVHVNWVGFRINCHDWSGPITLRLVGTLLRIVVCLCVDRGMWPVSCWREVYWWECEGGGLTTWGGFAGLISATTSRGLRPGAISATTS